MRYQLYFLALGKIEREKKEKCKKIGVQQILPDTQTNERPCNATMLQLRLVQYNLAVAKKAEMYGKLQVGVQCLSPAKYILQ